MEQLTIGILALQGDVSEHAHAVKKLGARAIAVKYQKDLDQVDGLIIPGGESTTINKLRSTQCQSESLLSKLKTKALAGMPVYGTCMGSILLAKSIEDSKQETLSLMDITVKRNAYGSQRSSFETYLKMDSLGPEPFQAIFIRAPQIASADCSNVEILAKVDNVIVAAKQENYLATTFHPELVDDLRIHRLFLEMVLAYKQNPGVTIAPQVIQEKVRLKA